MPPDAIISIPVLSDRSFVCSIFGPDNMPSFDISVYTIVFTPISFIASASEIAVLSLTFSQPSTATIPFFASIPTTICSAPKFSIACLIKSGFSTAFVPMIARYIPRLRTVSISSSVLIPPPSWTGTDTLSTIFFIVSEFTEWPPLAPSRSTVCINLAPSASKLSAISYGLSEYTVTSLKSPFFNLTHFPSFISIAG